jgi:hypothetical protein
LTSTSSNCTAAPSFQASQPPSYSKHKSLTTNPEKQLKYVQEEREERDQKSPYTFYTQVAQNLHRKDVVRRICKCARIQPPYTFTVSSTPSPQISNKIEEVTKEKAKEMYIHRSIDPSPVIHS